MIDCVSVDQMRDFDKNTILNKVPSIELMGRAAKSVYDEIDEKDKKIYIISGSGNNGGDGIALCNIFKNNGYNPYLYLISNNVSLDSKYYLDKLEGYKNIFNIKDCDYKADIIVDCIFGTGFHGDVDKDIQKIIENINASNAYIISVDIPSGLNGNSGLKTVCVKANKTIAIEYIKYGHILNDGKDNVGKLVFKDIGIEKTQKVAKIVEDKDIHFQKRLYNTHKGSYGRAIIIGGCENYLGAIKIANMGISALRVGAGLNTIATIKSKIDVLSQSIVESTLYPLSEIEGKINFKKDEIDHLLSNASAIAIGMGMGVSDENKKLIQYVIENYSIPVLIDADGLNSISSKLFKNKKANIIITPHIKEFSRLLNIDVGIIQNNPVYYAEKFAKENDIVVLLKGCSTIITNGEDTFFVINGTPALAKGGSGDTLSGVILGLLAQGRDLVQSAYTGAYLCAKAALDLEKDYSQYGVLASDVAKQIGKYISQN